jgi:hypothetical protein
MLTHPSLKVSIETNKQTKKIHTYPLLSIKRTYPTVICFLPITFIFFSLIFSGNLMQQRITRIQTEQANEIARLIKQYITIDQRMKGVPMPAAPQQQVIKIVPLNCS